MKQTSPATQVRAARIQLESAERQLANSARPWKQRLREHRQALALAGGFTSGLALVVLPARWWARAGAVAGRAAAGAARSVLTPMLLGAAVAWLRPNRSSNGSVAAKQDA